MSDPYYLALWIGIGALVWACAVLVIAEAIGSCARTRDRLDAEALAVEAADFGEPTRAQIEQAMSETPIYAATIAHVAKYEAAEIDVEWSLLWDVIA